MLVNKYEMAAALYGDLSVDCALPQDWVDELTCKGFDARPHFVWAYPEGNVFGLPFPITREAHKRYTELVDLPQINYLRAMYWNHAYSMHPPTVCSVAWSADDWVRWINGNGTWRFTL